MGSFRAELLLLRKRAATWVLLAVAIALGTLFTYVLPYASYVSASADERRPGDLTRLLPEQLVSSVLGEFPFYMGVITLILGVVAFGSEYGWNTLKTTLMQRPGRLRLLGAKLAALAVALVVFVATIFVAGALSSIVVAMLDGASMTWPSIGDVALAFGAAWLLLAVWTALGVLLAILSRGTALAIGLGLLYGLIVEGIITGFGANIALLEDVAQSFLRTNGYSLVAPLRVTITATDGPGFFSGPFVDTWQALAVIVAYVVGFSAIAGLVLRRRDVA